MGFKTFLVAVDRLACVLYKEALDKYLPPEYSQVVFSPAHPDRTTLRPYHLTPEREKEVRKDFAHKEKLPKILIVTEKLLNVLDLGLVEVTALRFSSREAIRARPVGSAST